MPVPPRTPPSASLGSNHPPPSSSSLFSKGISPTSCSKRHRLSITRFSLSNGSVLFPVGSSQEIADAPSSPTKPIPPGVPDFESMIKNQQLVIRAQLDDPLHISPQVSTPDGGGRDQQDQQRKQQQQQPTRPHKSPIRPKSYNPSLSSAAGIAVTTVVTKREEVTPELPLVLTMADPSRTATFPRSAHRAEEEVIPASTAALVEMTDAQRIMHAAGWRNQDSVSGLADVGKGGERDLAHVAAEADVDPEVGMSDIGHAPSYSSHHHPTVRAQRLAQAEQGIGAAPTRPGATAAVLCDPPTSPDPLIFPGGPSAYAPARLPIPAGSSIGHGSGMGITHDALDRIASSELGHGQLQSHKAPAAGSSSSSHGHSGWSAKRLFRRAAGKEDQNQVLQEDLSEFANILSGKRAPRKETIEGRVVLPHYVPTPQPGTKTGLTRSASGSRASSSKKSNSDSGHTATPPPPMPVLSATSASPSPSYPSSSAQNKAQTRSKRTSSIGNAKEALGSVFSRAPARPPRGPMTNTALFAATHGDSASSGHSKSAHARGPGFWSKSQGAASGVSQATNSVGSWTWASSSAGHDWASKSDHSGAVVRARQAQAYRQLQHQPSLPPMNAWGSPQTPVTTAAAVSCSAIVATTPRSSHSSSSSSSFPIPDAIVSTHSLGPTPGAAKVQQNSSFEQHRQRRKSFVSRVPSREDVADASFVPTLVSSPPTVEIVRPEQVHAYSNGNEFGTGLTATDDHRFSSASSGLSGDPGSSSSDQERFPMATAGTLADAVFSPIPPPPSPTDVAQQHPEVQQVQLQSASVPPPAPYSIAPYLQNISAPTMTPVVALDMRSPTWSSGSPRSGLTGASVSRSTLDSASECSANTPATSSAGSYRGLGVSVILPTSTSGAQYATAAYPMIAYEDCREEIMTPPVTDKYEYSSNPAVAATSVGTATTKMMTTRPRENSTSSSSSGDHTGSSCSGISLPAATKGGSVRVQHPSRSEPPTDRDGTVIWHMPTRSRASSELRLLPNARDAPATSFVPRSPRSPRSPRDMVPSSNNYHPRAVPQWSSQDSSGTIGVHSEPALARYYASSGSDHGAKARSPNTLTGPGGTTQLPSEVHQTQSLKMHGSVKPRGDLDPALQLYAAPRIQDSSPMLPGSSSSSSGHGSLSELQQRPQPQHQVETGSTATDFAASSAMRARLHLGIMSCEGYVEQARRSGTKSARVEAKGGFVIIDGEGSVLYVVKKGKSLLKGGARTVLHRASADGPALMRSTLPMFSDHKRCTLQRIKNGTDGSDDARHKKKEPWTGTVKQADYFGQRWVFYLPSNRDVIQGKLSSNSSISSSVESLSLSSKISQQSLQQFKRDQEQQKLRSQRQPNQQPQQQQPESWIDLNQDDSSDGDLSSVGSGVNDTADQDFELLQTMGLKPFTADRALPPGVSAVHKSQSINDVCLSVPRTFSGSSSTSGHSASAITTTFGARAAETGHVTASAFGLKDGSRRYEWKGAHIIKLVECQSAPDSFPASGVATPGPGARDRVVGLFRRNVRDSRGGGDLEVEADFPDMEALILSLMHVLDWLLNGSIECR